MEGLDSQQGHTTSRPALGFMKPFAQRVSGAVSLGGNWHEHKADHSPLSSAKVKKSCSYTSIIQYVFMVWCLIKHSNNFIFINHQTYIIVTK
jgi:hypothetical protein